MARYITASEGSDVNAFQTNIELAEGKNRHRLWMGRGGLALGIGAALLMLVTGGLAGFGLLGFGAANGFGAWLFGNSFTLMTVGAGSLIGGIALRFFSRKTRALSKAKTYMDRSLRAENVPESGKRRRWGRKTYNAVERDKYSKKARKLTDKLRAKGLASQSEIDEFFANGGFGKKKREEAPKSEPIKTEPDKKVEPTKTEAEKEEERKAKEDAARKKAEEERLKKEAFTPEQIGKLREGIDATCKDLQSGIPDAVREKTPKEIFCLAVTDKNGCRLVEVYDKYLGDHFVSQIAVTDAIMGIDNKIAYPLTYDVHDGAADETKGHKKDTALLFKNIDDLKKHRENARAGGDKLLGAAAAKAVAEGKAGFAGGYTKV